MTEKNLCVCQLNRLAHLSHQAAVEAADDCSYEPRGMAIYKTRRKHD